MDGRAHATTGVRYEMTTINGPCDPITPVYPLHPPSSSAIVPTFANDLVRRLLEQHRPYLVLWLGADKTTRPRDVNRLATGEELKQRLEAELSADESHKVSVIVMDVTMPG